MADTGDGRLLVIGDVGDLGERGRPQSQDGGKSDKELEGERARREHETPWSTEPLRRSR
jgi:hypothetical protein